jgi:hypothetical protein
MRFQIVVAALVVPLTATAVAFASTRGSEGGRPDLSVSSISTASAVVFQGSGFRVTDRTRNIGSASAGPTVTQYYLASNGHRTAVGRRSVPRLRPHRSSLGTANAYVPATLELGAYSLVACANGKAGVHESNERNNCRTAATKVFVKKPPPRV